MQQGPETYQEEQHPYDGSDDEMREQEEEEQEEQEREQQDEQQQENAGMEEEENFTDDVNHPALPGTPAAVSVRNYSVRTRSDLQARTLSKFYTPQPRRDFGTPRRSLATMGPAVRFKPAPFTPNFNARPVHLVPRSRVSLGPPSRGPARMMAPVKAEPETVKPEEEHDEEQMDEADVKPTFMGTPQRAANKAEVCFRLCNHSMD